MLASQHWAGSLYTATGQRKYLTAAERTPGSWKPLSRVRALISAPYA
jgi:hypothetical protein